VLRIVQLANFYTPTSGGLRTCLDEIGRGYRAAGHECALVVPGKVDADRATSAGRRVVVRSPRLPGSGGYRVLTNRRRVLGVLDALAPDVLEVSDKLSLGWLAPWSRSNGVPLVLFSHERIDAMLYSRVPRWFPLSAAADVANRRLSALAGHVVVTSRFAAAEFERIGAANLRRVPLGVDLATFSPTGSSHVDGEGEVVRLVMVSRLSREKRPERAIEALRLLRDGGIRAELRIIGDGPLRRRLTRQSAGLPVTFLGHVSQRQAVAEEVARADVALSPSPAETFGLATLEALACGTPVVVPGRGAAGELIGEPASGVICDGTPAGLASAVQALLGAPADERRAAARAAAERFEWSATVDGMLALYHAIHKRPALH
jgi:alpha-1,6-mannosyltransferase